MTRLLLIVLSALLIVGSAAAQETTPDITPDAPTATDLSTLTPTPITEGDILIYGGVEVLFPQALRFVIGVEPPLFELESAFITIEFTGIEPETRQLDLPASATVGFPYSALNYIWDFTTETVPPLFSTVRYRWRVNALDGRHAIVDGEFIFQDERLLWLRQRDADIQLALGAPTAPPAGTLIIVREAYDALRRITGLRPTYRWLVYDTAVQPGCDQTEDGLPFAFNRSRDAGIPCDPALALQVYNQQGYDVLRRPPDLSFDDMLIEYMVRDFYAPSWSLSRPPQWFINGFAQFFQVAPKQDNFLIARAAVQDGATFSIEALRAAPPLSGAARSVWRAQSESMIRYLIDQVGLERVYALASVDQDFEAAYRALVGAPSDQLPLAWARWLNTSAAETAYGVTPYQPPPPTPRPTSTPSLTWTPTYTPSITLTPTVTVTPSPTRIPSVTPTPTLDLPTATPTVTPRPPGSLPTVTPIPPPTVAQALAQPAVQSAVLIVLIVILVILVIAAWRLGRT